jgi:amidase
MSSSLEAIEAFMETVISSKPWLLEPALIPMPWAPYTLSPTAEAPLRLGVMYHDGIVLPHPPVTRSLSIFEDKVSRHMPNVQIVPFQPYKHDEGWAIASSLYLTDGGESDIQTLEKTGEPMKPLTEWMLKNNPGVQKLSREELEYWNEEREEYRLEYARHWNLTGQWDDESGQWINCVDAVICPVAPWVAAQHNTSKYWTYTAIWNLLDYSALAFGSPRIGRASKELDRDTTRSSFLSDIDKEIWQICASANLK